jgi:hypothetical protein
MAPAWLIADAQWRLTVKAVSSDLGSVLLMAMLSLDLNGASSMPQTSVRA